MNILIRDTEDALLTYTKLETGGINVIDVLIPVRRNARLGKNMQTILLRF
jgi:hypothetical protein